MRKRIIQKEKYILGISDKWMEDGNLVWDVRLIFEENGVKLMFSSITLYDLKNLWGGIREVRAAYKEHIRNNALHFIMEDK